MNLKHTCFTVQELKLIILMVTNQVASGGVTVLYKLAVADGMKVKILVVYRLIFATVFMVPIALVFERKTRPKFSRMIAFQGFVSGLLGAALGSNLNAESLALMSATFVTAMYNLIPALTFIMAIIFRLERLDIKKSAGKAKVLGTALSIGGAMVLTFYKGMDLTVWSTHVNLLQNGEAATNQLQVPHHDSFLGTLLSLSSCFCYAAWYIVQAKMSQNYPCYSSTVLMCFNGAIMAGIYAICTDWHLTEWKLGWNIRLLAATYLGIIGSGLVVAISAWGTRVRGPLYVSSFSPLTLIFVVVVGSFILGEKLQLASVIGSVVIIMGLNLVLWGKEKEMKMAQSDSIRTMESSYETSAFADRNQTGNSDVSKRDVNEETKALPVAVEEV